MRQEARLRTPRHEFPRAKKHSIDERISQGAPLPPETADHLRQYHSSIFRDLRRLPSRPPPTRPPRRSLSSGIDIRQPIYADASFAASAAILGDPICNRLTTTRGYRLRQTRDGIGGGVGSITENRGEFTREGENPIKAIGKSLTIRRTGGRADEPLNLIGAMSHYATRRRPCFFIAADGRAIARDPLYTAARTYERIRGL